MSQNNRKNTNESDQTGDVMSWVIIFILMFAFPPLGLVMLILKMRSYAKPNNSANSSSRFDSQNTHGATHSSRTDSHSGSSSNHQGANTSDSAHWTANQARDAAEQAINQASAFAQSAIKEAQTVIRDVTGAVRDELGQFEDWLGKDDDKKASGSGQQTGSATSNADRDTIIRASGSARDTSQQYTTKTSQFKRPTTYHSNPGQQRQNYKQDKKNASSDKRGGKAISAVLLAVAIMFFILSFVLFALGIDSVWGSALINSPWFAFSMGAGFLTSGVALLFSRSTLKKRLGRYNHYYAYISGKSVVPISSIAQTAGLSLRTVRRDIQNMINEGYFDSGTYIDKGLDSLILCGDAAEEIRKSVFEDTLQSDEVNSSQYMSILSELRELNRSVADVTISEKIDRIEELTAKIFRIVEEQPEKKNQIRRFESYYLPTTMKLIRSYSTLEKQGVKGENIMATKENIGRILDTLATGYEQQLDQLFKADAMDIATDISVLENLMQQDGLASDKADFNKPMTG